jgi:threonine dehydrogenase-like Zn-dependent dehydrogenase
MSIRVSLWCALPLALLLAAPARAQVLNSVPLTGPTIQPESATDEEPADAVVRVTRTAICGSDLHFFHGKAPIEPGDVLGHEAVGVVEAVGPNVERFSPGDRVVVAFNIACGACWFCLRGEHQLCDDFRNLGAGAFGGNLAGAQATYVRVPVADVNLLHVPDDMDDERGLFVGDILTTGVFTASIAEIEPGSTVQHPADRLHGVGER